MQDKAQTDLQVDLQGTLQDIFRPPWISPPWIYDEQKYYQDLEYNWVQLPLGNNPRYPKATDVTVNSMFDPFTYLWLTGEDGQVWFANAGTGADPIKSIGGTGLRRLAIGPHGKILWCVGSGGTLWKPGPVGSWIQAQTQGQISGPIEDVTVDGNDAWLTGEDGTIWITQNGLSFQEATVLIGFKRLAAGADTSMWGIASDGTLWWQYRPTRTWYMTAGVKLEDLSVGYDGVVWLVNQAGQVWTTKDGNTFKQNPGTGFRRIAAGRYSIAYGVKTDGTVWMWSPWSTKPSGGSGGSGSGGSGSGGSGSGGSGSGGSGGTVSAPTISCSTTPPDTFNISGSGFLPNTTVTIRGANVTTQANNVFWTTSSSSTGTVQYSLTVPNCVQGITIYFSATDGRSDPNDLFTGKLWSKVAACSCPG